MHRAMKIALIVVMLLSAVTVLSEEVAPTISIVSASKPFTFPAIFPEVSKHSVCTEVPAWVVTDRQVPLYYLPTSWTHVLHTRKGKSILRDKDAFDPKSAMLVSESDICASNFGEPNKLDPKLLWRRNYWGIYSAHALEKGTIAFLHGENKNEAFPWKKRYYDSTVLPKQVYKRPDHYSGHFDGGYRDYWPAYFAFLAASWTPVDGKKSIDLGPVVWPSSGYFKDGKKAGHGPRAPSSIIHDGHIYVFYFDNPHKEAEGSTFGIKVARAPIGEDMPGPFMTYHNGSFSEPSLPKGFNRDKAREFLATPGGKSSRVHPELSWNTTRFSVAKLKGTPYFIGVDERYHPEDGKTVGKLSLRISEDLVNWSNGVELPGSTMIFGQGLSHPVLANADYTSNVLVLPDDFLVVGSGFANGKMQAIRVKIRIKKPERTEQKNPFRLNVKRTGH